MPNRFSCPVQAIVHGPDFDLSKVKFNLKTSFCDKPETALWTSTYQDDFSEIGWIKWNMGEGPLDTFKNCLYKVVPKDGVRLYEINSEEDVTSCRLPKLDGPSAIARFFGFQKERQFTEGFIDYQALAKRGYDGLHVTEDGAWLGHSFGDISEKTIRIMCSFDCESTVWFHTDWIESIELVTDDLRSILELE